MSAIKTAAAVALQQGYRDHLEHRAAVALADIEKRIAAFQLLPTTRLDEAATTVGLQLSAAELSTVLGESPPLGGSAARRGAAGQRRSAGPPC